MPELIQKFEAIQKEIQIPISFLAATDKNDSFRKPSVGLMSYIERHQGYEFNKSESFYCGDAAGRPASAKAKKDHSADDLKFASNIKVKFHTPESLFLGQPMNGVQ